MTYGSCALMKTGAWLMKIVVLDAYTLNSGDLDWAPLHRLGGCDIYDRTGADQVLERCAGAEIVLTNKVVLTARQLRLLPQLRYIGVLATGTNVVDVAAAIECGMVVTNVPAYSTPSVVQMVFALLLEMTQQVGHHSARVHEGAWCRSPDFTFRQRPLLELAGMTMGIVGFGQIGQGVARVAESFGMNVLVNVRKPYRFNALQRGDGPVWVELDGLFAMADVVSLNCPLTAETQALVDGRRLAMMKPGSFLINTARGGLLDELAVAAALHSGQLAGVGVDVLSCEPPAPDNPLLQAPNCFITPHIGWATLAARQRLLAEAVANIEAYIAGVPRNVVTAQP